MKTGSRGRGRQDRIEERHDDVTGSNSVAKEVFPAIMVPLPKEDSSYCNRCYGELPMANRFVTRFPHVTHPI